MPEMMGFDLSELEEEYPPRLLVYVKQAESGSSFNLQVIGLDRECSFAVPVLGEESSILCLEKAYNIIPFHCF